MFGAKLTAREWWGNLTLLCLLRSFDLTGQNCLLAVSRAKHLHRMGISLENPVCRLWGLRWNRNPYNIRMRWPNARFVVPTETQQCFPRHPVNQKYIFYCSLVSRQLANGKKKVPSGTTGCPGKRWRVSVGTIKALLIFDNEVLTNWTTEFSQAPGGPISIFSFTSLLVVDSLGYGRKE